MPHPDPYQITNSGEIASPALVLYRDLIEANLAAMLRIAGGPERLRPHVKTHKLEPLVRRQIELGIGKFKAATIAEVEMCARAGAPDVLLALQPVGPAIGRLVALARRFPETEFSCVVDDPSVVAALGEAARWAGVDVGVWLDLDCGMHRTGIAPGPAAGQLYAEILRTAGLEPRGLHAYDGHLHGDDPAERDAECEAAMAPVLKLRRDLESAGLPVPALAAGGSPTFPCHARHADRECSPGTTVLWDFGYADHFPELPFRPAALLLTRVISRPIGGRLCLDLGHKAVAAENPHPRVRFPTLPDAVAVVHSEEHLVIATAEAARFQVGDELLGIPRHICPTVALHGEATIVENGRAVETWPITARNRRYLTS